MLGGPQEQGNAAPKSVLWHWGGGIGWRPQGSASLFCLGLPVCLSRAWSLGAVIFWGGGEKISKVTAHPSSCSPKAKGGACCPGPMETDTNEGKG